jgi:hypothetical protein
MVRSITCLAYHHLKQNYERCVRRWAHLLLTEVDQGTPKLLRRTLQERDEAGRKINLHQAFCPVCKRSTLRVIEGGREADEVY